MLQNMYYNENAHSDIGSAIDATNNTPFSVKDILNLDQNNGYNQGYHMSS